ncbi:hypothetical protein AGMMS49940_01930 [Spirochaetia bacterium]|nr:hypothetical protein AGMMS49940_01930 [Spirochaetia bacterium]
MQVGELLAQIRDRIPRRMVVLGLGGAALVLMLGFVAIALIQNHSGQVKSQAAARELADSFKPLTIASEDFFLPEEPDSLPEFIPERPLRSAWTVEDARLYWTDPLAGNEKLWRDRFGAVIDDLMEGVP